MTPVPRAAGDQVIPRPPDWRPGGVAPWAGLSAAELAVDLSDIRRRFTGRQAKLSGLEGERPASAVLAPFYEDDRGVAVLLTRRAQTLRRHAGEVSFPGGREEPGDVTLVATALRETDEEIGLRPSAVDVIGELDHLTTVVSPTYVKPIIGIVTDDTAPAQLRGQPGEVEAILRVPLARLTDPTVFWEEWWRWEPDAPPRPMTFFDLGDDTLWGATAVVMRRFLSELYGLDDPGSVAPPV